MGHKRWRVEEKKGERAIGRTNARLETRDEARGNERSGAQTRDRGCQGARGGRGRKKLNRGLGATSEEMVGPKNWRGPGPGLGGERGEGNEDEDADEDADQENEEKEVTEQEKQEEEEGASGDTRRGAAGAPVIRRGGRGCRPSRGVSPANVIRARSGGRVNPSPRVARFL